MDQIKDSRRILTQRMYELINLANAAKGNSLPFAIYSAVHEQQLLNVPISQPILIFVLGGCKSLQVTEPVTCKTGEFIFLGSSPNIHMRNIPDGQQYFALLIEFESGDFEVLPPAPKAPVEFASGTIDHTLIQALRQFIEWAQFAPQTLWGSRRRELLQLLFHLGHTDIARLAGEKTVSQQVHKLIIDNLSEDQAAHSIAGALAMSESTLRRKLSAENTSLQQLKDQARLGNGLHLLQTTDWPIIQIAEHCGYQSQSRFSSRFKQRFGLTPSALRQTRMIEKGECLSD